jgi:hypothetical protein
MGPPRAFTHLPPEEQLSYFQQQHQVFEPSYLEQLRRQIRASPYFVTNNLNRDFVGTQGFSVVFRLTHLVQVGERFPYFLPYLDQALRPNCNAFYLNPLGLRSGSRVDPHIDRSLRSYCKTIDPPAVVSVLYIAVSADLRGGELILRSRQRQVGQIYPRVNTLVHFQGDLTHSVNAVENNAVKNANGVKKARGSRLSLVCEQYSLSPRQLEEIPTFTIESRALGRADSPRSQPRRGNRR